MAHIKPVDDPEATAANFFKNDYQDRGMVKWQGYFLSDHTSALKTEAKEDEQMWHQQIPDPMMPTRIKELLEQAQTKSQTVIIYTNVTDLNQRFQIPIIGRIQGWENQMLYLGDANFVAIKDIRAVIIDSVD
ncbi:hypothetical protein [Lacticaseibacillus saniviri]|uniref:DNA-directed RNA polymerase beta subunit n=1 Tax=Lacticaseibacillus saniviri JCM 17471 = DSM 24301 TaxID=1293598 RepID=A0A0R2MQM9_9LACO|nr:hypothetical protein [Lacticaseibacillus saniviri]KRO15918.1 hypothetical protein IV56_GL002109 [Lacticaseibacillus saniviri JCM 17471 = DSM 24301]